MKSVTTIIKYIVSIILTISIILFLVINLASSTILNKNYVLSKLEEINYYDEVYKQVESNFENYIHQSGLDEIVLKDIVSKEKIKKDSQLILNKLYEGSEEEFETQEIKDNLNKNIENTLGNTKLNITQKNAINSFVNKICEEYKNSITYYDLGKIHNNYEKIVKYAGIAKKVALVTIAVSIILLLLLNIKSIYKAFILCGISLTSTGIFFIITNNFINMKIKIQNILILNNTISQLIRNILADILNKINQYGGILLAIGLALIIIFNLIHSIVKGKNKTEEEEN